MNYHPVIAENQTNSNAGFQDTKKAGEEGTQTYVLFPITNDFSAAGPSNAAMPNVEDLNHSNDTNDVGAEADINNLEPIISDPSWIEAMQEELLQFKMHKVWILVDLPYEKRQLVLNGFTEIKRMKEAELSETKQGLLLKDIHRKKELSMKMFLLQ
nr:hypothetical protein [Tanacetum cinerariifolium]